MLNDDEMRQAALDNPGRIIYSSWNPNRRYPKWKPLNFHPDNWRKIEDRSVKGRIIPIKEGFDKVVDAAPPSGLKLNLKRPESWDFDRYGYRIGDGRVRRR